MKEHQQSVFERGDLSVSAFDEQKHPRTSQFVLSKGSDVSEPLRQELMLVVDS